MLAEFNNYFVSTGALLVIGYLKYLNFFKALFLALPFSWLTAPKCMQIPNTFVKVQQHVRVFGRGMHSDARFEVKNAFKCMITINFNI